MASKPPKKQKPEDMLIRIIRVAEILAKADVEPAPSSTDTFNSSGVTDESHAVRVQKTQP